MRLSASPNCLRARGVQPGKAVSIVLPNSLEFMVVFLAVARAGAIAAPLNSAYTTDEFTFYMEDAEAQLTILPLGEHAAREAAEQLGVPTIEASLDDSGRTLLSKGGDTLTARRDAPAPSPDDVALFLHTSGTTSRPKGVPLTHGNLAASIKNISDTYRLTPDDIAMVVMPLFHVHGLIGVSLSTAEHGRLAGDTVAFQRKPILGASKRTAVRHGTQPCRRFTRFCWRARTKTARHTAVSGSSGLAHRRLRLRCSSNWRRGSARRCWKHTE